MLTKYRVFNEEDESIHEAPVSLELMQDRKGLHVVAEIIFRPSAVVIVARMELEFGNRIWVQQNVPVMLDGRAGDSFKWSFDSFLTESEA